MTSAEAAAAGRNASETTPETTPEAAVRRYMEFWNSEPEEQRRLAPATFTADVEYRAEVGVLRGAEPLIEFRTGFIGHMGAASFVAREDPQSHNDRARLRWEIRLAAGESFAEGTDVLALDPDGRITSVVAFLDRAPEGFDPHAHEHADA